MIRIFAFRFFLLDFDGDFVYIYIYMRLKLLPLMFVFAVQLGSTVAHAQWTETSYYLDWYENWNSKTVVTTGVNNSSSVANISYTYACPYFEYVVQDNTNDVGSNPVWRTSFNIVYNASDDLVGGGTAVNVPAYSQVKRVLDFSAWEGQNAHFHSPTMQWFTRYLPWEIWDEEVEFEYTPITS